MQCLQFSFSWQIPLKFNFTNHITIYIICRILSKLAISLS
nr:MAG TPA: hypothetical protein [Bacteriophage sp.]